MQPLEIERKFLIAMPDSAWLLSREGAQCEEIAQTYLIAELGEERRVRRKSAQGTVVFVKTTKRAISGAAREEIEQEITREEYAALLLEADPNRRTIEKTRISFPYAGHLLEIDLYPFWRDKAILEAELLDEREELRLPQEIRVLQEVTDDPRYKNAALAIAQDPSAL